MDVVKGAIARCVRPVSNLHIQGAAPNVFILSTPRSGSTWLMETIAAERSMKICNEPFNIRKPQIAAALGISEWDVLESPQALPKIERYLKAFESGRLSVGFKNLLPFRKGYRPITRRIVFKILHACENRVDWLRSRFNAQIVYLLRHPAPVSLSRRELPRLSSLIESRLSGPQREFARAILESGSPVERAALDWGLQNKPLLDAADQTDLVVTYEQFVMEPQVVVKRLVEVLNLKSADAVMKSVAHLSGSVAISAEDRRALLERRHGNPSDLVTSWQSKMTADHVAAIDRVLSSLEIDVYSATDPWPKSHLWIRPQDAAHR